MSVEPSQPRPRPAILGPVLIAAVFLAVIGASVGYVLGAREDDNNGAPANGVVNTTADPAPPPPPDGGIQPPPAPPPDEPPPRADRCPPQTERLARQAGSPGGLERKLYIWTGLSEVWICNDRDGRLFYQGHRGNPGERLIDGQNALFLTDVVVDGETFVATNRSGGKVTTYRVSVKELVIQGNGDPQTEPVKEHQP